MNSKILSFLGLILVMLLFSAQNTYAQNDKTVKKGVSAADQKAIAELFKGVDQSKYRLQFNNKATTLGKRAVKMTDVEQVRKITNPGEAAGWIVFVVEGDDVIYVLAVGSSDLVSVLGKEKTLKLNQIMAKYQTR
jgi:hypothetical protein